MAEALDLMPQEAQTVISAADTAAFFVKIKLNMFRVLTRLFLPLLLLLVLLAVL